MAATRDPAPADGRRPRLTRVEAQARTRERLLDAAAEVFGERGFRAASLTDVADRAGYTIGAVYSNFASKDELFHALMAERLRATEAALADAFGDTDGASGDRIASVEERVAAELDRMVAAEDAVPSQWWRLLNEFRSYAAADPATRAELAAAEARCRDILARHIERFAAGAGLALPMSPSELAELSTALTDGLRAAHAEGRSSLSPGEGLRRVVGAVLASSTPTHPD